MSYLRTLEETFAPQHTAIVLNEGTVPSGRPPRQLKSGDRQVYLPAGTERRTNGIAAIGTMQLPYHWSTCSA